MVRKINQLTKSPILSILLVTLFFIPALFQAGPTPANPIKDLKLSDEQIIKASKIERSYTAEIKKINLKLKLIDLDLKEEILKIEPDCSVFDKKLKTRMQLHVEQDMARVNALIQFKGLLNTEQLKMFLKLRLQKKLFR